MHQDFPTSGLDLPARCAGSVITSRAVLLRFDPCQTWLHLMRKTPRRCFVSGVGNVTNLFSAYDLFELATRIWSKRTNEWAKKHDHHRYPERHPDISGHQENFGDVAVG